jgi:hypothetical protein
VIKSSIEAQGKGWFVGPWNSRVYVAVGYSDRGIDEPHSHDEMSELYLEMLDRIEPVHTIL